ncbi:MAG: Rrf2 family transcriptional regulator [Defluviitaleaceae bacterium]|nr:Rrf2 family transcriptional regulator [Defluviitaleaceae bacterium]
MLLTKECDYGLRIIRALSGGEKKTVEAICEAERIPGKFAYKILKKLENAGFLKSLRGRDGGYQLIKPLHDFTLHDVIISVDERLFVFECLCEGASCPLNTLGAPCAVRKEFAHAQSALEDVLNRKSMYEIINGRVQEQNSEQ